MQTGEGKIYIWMRGSSPEGQVVREYSSVWIVWRELSRTVWAWWRWDPASSSRGIEIGRGRCLETTNQSNPIDNCPPVETVRLHKMSTSKVSGREWSFTSQVEMAAPQPRYKHLYPTCLWYSFIWPSRQCPNVTSRREYGRAIWQKDPASDNMYVLCRTMHD